MKNGKYVHLNAQDANSALLGIAIAFMFCVFAPLDAFFANRDEFWFSLSQLLPVLLLTFLGVAVTFSFAMGAVQRRKTGPYIYGLFVYAYLFFYIQGNYIPRNYGVLNGEEVNWSDYGAYGIMSLLLAAVCMLLWIFSVLKIRDKIYNIGRYLCIFIMLIQIVTIGVVWTQDRITGEGSPAEKRVVTNKDMLNLSADNNVLIFLLDTFDAQDMLNLLQGEDAGEYTELFGGGFTFYPDTLGAYPTTKAAVPQLLTGAWYYNDKPYRQYIQDAYGESPIMAALRANEYSVGLYTEDRLLNEDADLYGNVDVGSYYVKDYPALAAKIYQLVAFNYMPHQLKRFFGLDTGEFEELKETSLEGGAYSYEVQANYAWLMEKGVSVTGTGNCFRFYHTAGVHPQYTFGKDLTTEAGRTYDVKDEAEGNCTYLKTFFDELRKAGIYDSSTIIVMADHGHYGYSQNPLFMLKNAGETEGFVISDEKMSFAYLPDILVSLLGGEKVSEEYIRKYGDRERHFLYYTWDDSWARDYLPRMQEICADGYAGDAASLRMTGKEYIGRDDYAYYGEVVSTFQSGDPIDTIFFYTDQYNADRYVVEGLSWQEDWGSWTEGDRVVLTLPLNGTDAPYIGINMSIYSAFYQPQPVTVLVNGNYICEDTVRDKQSLVFAFENPGTDVVELTLLLPDCIAPSQIMESEDHRELALGLLKMEVTEAEYEPRLIPDDGIIRFGAKEYNANRYVINGISPPEEAGAWTAGGRLSAYLSLKGGVATDQIHISMDLESVMNGQQEITVEVNGEVVFADRVSEGQDAVSFDVTRPEDGNILMEVRMPDAARPLEPEKEGQAVNPGIMIQSIKISQ